jgi:hypothetical protein
MPILSQIITPSNVLTAQTTKTLGGVSLYGAGNLTSLNVNSATATSLATGRTISITGDLTYTSGSFDGSANVTGTGTLANSGVTAGTYTNATVVVDAKGRVTSASSGSGGGVTSFNTRTGAVTLSSGDVTGALGYTPLSLAGGTMTGTITTTQGNGNGINLNAAGSGFLFGTNQDNASSTQANVKLTSWFGIGFSPSISGQPVPQWENAAWINCRTGDISGRGALTMSGNVTAFSDERLKTDWALLPTDFVERLAQVKSGTYTRIDSNERQAGSSAQDWQKLLPEVVQTSSDGDRTLALAYGNAALVSTVELAKRVVDQEARIAKLEALVEQLFNRE